MWKSLDFHKRWCNMVYDFTAFTSLYSKVQTARTVTTSMRWQRIRAVTSSKLLPCEKHWLPTKWISTILSTNKKLCLWLNRWTMFSMSSHWIRLWWKPRLFHTTTISMRWQRVSDVTSSKRLPCEKKSWLPPKWVSHIPRKNISNYVCVEYG